MEIQFLFKVLITFVLIKVVGLFVYMYNSLVRKPEMLRSVLRNQGITGPTPSLLFGNILEMKKLKEDMTATPTIGAPAEHDCVPFLFPFFEHWQKKYGEIFMFSLGTTQVLHVTQADMVKAITTCTSLDLGKPLYQARDRGSLLGQGIVTSNGPYWAHQRKIIAPELYMDKVKGMMSLVIDSTLALVNSWKILIDESKSAIANIKIDEHMRIFSADVISKACFGSNYSKGEDIFSKLASLQEASSKNTWIVGIPGFSYLPTKSNREAWALEKDIKSLILKVVKERKESGHEKDLLQMLLGGAEDSNLGSNLLEKFIVDNCKSIYLAGYETTAVSATWCLMLLASNPVWQECIRSEVREVCNGRIPNYDMLLKMKKLTMVINETLRLYPPVTVISREAFKDMKFGNINVPKGLNLWTFVLPIHTDTNIWGPDAYQFKPDRFTNGVKGACKEPHLYMPFGVGPRVCLGQNLAIVELKVLVALLVSNFSFTLSPSYVHSPALTLVIVPHNGVNLLVKKL